MKNMKMRTKLITGFLLVAMLTLVVSVFGVIGLIQLNDDEEVMYVQLENAASIGRLGVALQRVRINYRDGIIYIADEEKLKVAIDNIEYFQAAVEEEMHYLWIHLASVDGIVQLEKTQLELNRFQIAVEEMKGYLQAGDETDARKFLIVVSNMGISIQNELDILTENIDAGTRELKDENTRDAYSLTLVLTLLSAVSIGGAVMLGLYLAGIISKPVITMMGFLKQVGETGNLT
ncbi:MAG: MCP four helix bundle domain-containing protein, partial [Treponema sp.]|nr:MCP four helix bundle domain-containing protein [Treponema sp.]